MAEAGVAALPAPPRGSSALVHACLTEHCSVSPVLAASHASIVPTAWSPPMNGIIYLVGLVVIVLAILSLLGLR